MGKKVLVISFQSLTGNSGAGMARLGHMLSTELHKRGMLQHFIIHSKGKFDTEFASKPVTRISRYYLYIINKLVSTFSIPSYKSRYLQEILFDWFCQWRLKKDTDILFSTNPFMKHTFSRAKKLGMLVVLLPGTPEENYIFNIVDEENKKTGIHATDAYTYEKRLNHYNQSIQHVDKVIAPHPVVLASYTEAKHKAEIVSIVGHMTPDLKPTATIKKNNSTFHVGYVAHTVLLKGLHYLLAAWQDINESGTKNITLHIGGNADEPMKNYIDAHFKGLVNVKWHGHVSDIPAFMQQLDLLVVPSLVDAGPSTPLEAAYNSIPSIITDHCGSYELLIRNNPGCWVIPIRDKDAIKERILFAYNNRDVCKQTGEYARYNMQNYSMESFMQELADYLESKV